MVEKIKKRLKEIFCPDLVRLEKKNHPTSSDEHVAAHMALADQDDEDNR